MERDDANPTVDLRTILERLTDAASVAVESVVRHPSDADARTLEPVLSYLDVEERVLFDRADRVLVDGPTLTAAGRARHRVVLDLLPDGAAPARDALFDHIAIQRETLYPQLLHALDERDRDDLGAALEEARLSREEHEGRRSLPFET